MISEKSKAPVYEYLFDHEGSMSLIDFQTYPSWKLTAKVLIDLPQNMVE